ncbi:hypothetical protein Ocin01_13517 [Orchesella cincta]|uniref:Uncharacterized protein n=1 Tax=Orchesella cincta TaxID=48709 RepID=A0A1D2MJF9_ORCCI|nr:hypothetical protein Ocin01_13517 [Orchesella cincta]
MASTAKRSRRTPKNDDAASATTEDLESSTESRTGSKKLCIVCGEAASKKIEKDSNYDAMLQLYWCTLGLDVKPEACQKTDLCENCFSKMVKYYETNDIIVYFETYFKSMRLSMLKATLKGIAKWEKSGKPLNKIHNDIRNKYGNTTDLSEQEQEGLKQTLGMYKMTYSENENTSTSGDSKSKPRVVINLKKPGVEKEQKSEKINLKELASSSKSSSDEDSE